MCTKKFEISSRWINAYNTNPNYNWFLTDYIAHNTNFMIDKTSESFGTMCMPTGTGKSGETYKAIINYINDALENNKRLIINISSPLLKLNQQLSLDMMFVLLELYCNTTSPYYCDLHEKSMFFFNSSEQNPGYKLFENNKRNLNNVITNTICTCNITPNNFYNDFDEFVNSDKQIAIVCSCHKSLPTFVNYISEHNLKQQGFEIKNFLDESHTISDREFSDDESSKVDIETLCKYSTGCFAISATPDIKVTKIINKFSNNFKNLSDLDEQYFIHVYPKDAINDGMILAPLIDVWKTSYTELNEKMIGEIYIDSHVKNPTVKHQKILINCPCGNKGEIKKIRHLYNKLIKMHDKKIKDGKLRIYVTSFDTNFLSTTNENFKSMKDFTSSIDNAECDCIVLHVKQMIAGIDISSITQTVMYLTDINDTVIRTIIQTCGRCLRIGNGDRDGKYAKPLDERTKKFGLCTFVISTYDNETEDKLKTFFMRYYMLDNIKFTKQYSNCGGGNDTIGHPIALHNSRKFTFENTPFVTNIKKYINDKKSNLKRALRTTDPKTMILHSELINMLNEDNTAKIFDNREIVNIIVEELNKLK